VKSDRRQCWPHRRMENRSRNRSCKSSSRSASAAAASASRLALEDAATGAWPLAARRARGGDPTSRSSASSECTDCSSSLNSPKRRANAAYFPPLDRRSRTRARRSDLSVRISTRKRHSDATEPAAGGKTSARLITVMRRPRKSVLLDESWWNWHTPCARMLQSKEMKMRQERVRKRH
jgi:hypothetical protein